MELLLPNSRGGLLSRIFQPISNRNQKFITHLRPQAIDPRTRMVLFKLLNHATFDDLNGCISTGKQANVYHATKHYGQEFAVKVFKDRNHNIQGDLGMCTASTIPGKWLRLGQKMK